MKHIKLYENFDDIDIENILLDFIDDGKCIVEGNDTINVFSFEEESDMRR